MARVSPHKIPVNFGSSDESTEAMTFVLSLSGISEASAAQVAALGILAARHIDKSGKRPVLNEAVKLLARPGRTCSQMFEYIQTSDMSQLTRTTRSFLMNTCKAMLMGDPVAQRNSVANAVMVLTSESLRRSMEEEPGASMDDDLEDEDEQTLEQPAVASGETAPEPVAQEAVSSDESEIDSSDEDIKAAEAARIEADTEAAVAEENEHVQEVADSVENELADVLEEGVDNANEGVILTNDDFGGEADPVFGGDDAIQVVVTNTEIAKPAVSENAGAESKVGEGSAAANDTQPTATKPRFGFKRNK